MLFAKFYEDHEKHTRAFVLEWICICYVDIEFKTHAHCCLFESTTFVWGGWHLNEGVWENSVISFHSVKNKLYAHARMRARTYAHTHTCTPFHFSVWRTLRFVCMFSVCVCFAIYLLSSAESLVCCTFRLISHPRVCVLQKAQYCTFR